MKPLLLIDVDGVLNPFRRPGREWKRFRRTAADGRSYALWLNPAHGRTLLDFAERTGCELVWATTWEHAANTEIAPLVGLPELPVIEVGRPRMVEGSTVLWKTPAVAEYVAGRPFVWLDDDTDNADRTYLDNHAGVGEHLLIEIDGDAGLSDEDLDQAAEWMANLQLAKGAGL